jgi:signal transduction histidine kinase
MQNRIAISPFVRLRLAFDSVGGSAAAFRLPGFRTWMIALVAAIGYYLGSRIGFFFTPPNSPISTFWPPNAILLATFLLTPRRVWWVLVLMVLPAHFLIQVRTGVPALSALGWFIGNVGEALLGAACIRFFQKKPERLFASVRGVITFWVFGVLLAPLLTSFLDAGSTDLTGLGRGYWTLWMHRLTSNMVATLTVVPAIVTFVAYGIQWFRKASRARFFEAALLGVSSAVVTFLVFAKGHLFGNGPALLFAPLSVLVWAALRFGPTGLSFAALEVTLISVWSALQGRGIFEYSSPTDRVVPVHILLGLFLLPFMLIAVVVAEQREAVKNTRDQLIDAREQESHRIARELHTDIAGRLTLVGIGLDELRGTHTPLDRIYDQVSDALNALLQLCHKIYPFYAEYLGLTRGLIKLCRDTSEENGITVNPLVGDLPFELPLSVSLRIFRVAQLALQDVVERKASTADVRLTVTDGQAFLRIADDGTGIDLHDRETVGLAYVREQTLSLGGTFKAITGRDKGLVVETSIPVVKVSPSSGLSRQIGS